MPSTPSMSKSWLLPSAHSLPYCPLSWNDNPASCSDLRPVHIRTVGWLFWCSYACGNVCSAFMGYRMIMQKANHLHKMHSLCSSRCPPPSTFQLHPLLQERLLSHSKTQNSFHWPVKCQEIQFLIINIQRTIILLIQN